MNTDLFDYYFLSCKLYLCTIPIFVFLFFTDKQNYPFFYTINIKYSQLTITNSQEQNQLYQLRDSFQQIKIYCNLL